MIQFDLQPVLDGTLVQIRPMKPEDFEPMHVAASDPLIWEQHPNPLRYQRDVFQNYFDSGISSAGSLTVIDKKSEEIIGCSRYYDFNKDLKLVVIGYTFLARSHWGSIYH